MNFREHRFIELFGSQMKTNRKQLAVSNESRKYVLSE